MVVGFCLLKMFDLNWIWGRKSQLRECGIDCGFARMGYISNNNNYSNNSSSARKKVINQLMNVCPS